MGIIKKIGKIKDFFNKIRWIKKFVKKMGLNPLYILIPILLSFAVAFFEGASTVLLLPLLRGIVELDFSFAKQYFFINKVIFISPGFLSESMRIFIVLVGVVFILAVMKNVMEYISSLSLEYQIIKLNNNFKKFIFNRYLKFGKLFFDRNNQGYLRSVLSYTDIIGNLLIKLKGALNQILMLFVYIIIMAIISIKLTIFVIIIFPILHYSLAGFTKIIKKISEEQVGLRNQLGARIFNTLSCIPLIKAYTREEQEKKLFENEADKLGKLNFKMNKIKGLIKPIQDIMTLVAILLLVSAIALIFAKERIVEVSSFLVFIYLVKRSADTFNELNIAKFNLVSVSATIEELGKIMDDKNKFIIAGGKEEFKGLKNRIKFNHINFSYVKKVPVLKDVNFSIEKGKTIALVGPTGSGKTTIINLILRFYNYPNNSIKIDEISIQDFTLKSLMSKISLVSQEPMIFNDSIKNNIAYGFDNVQEEKIIEAAKKAQLYDFIMKLPEKFNTVVGDRGVKLSGGERQRLSIARAILKDAEILIFDEATSSLDTHTEKLIQIAISDVIKNRTAIVIAHRLSTIKHADKIVVINEGRIIEQGTLNELLEKKGKFFEMWQAQKFD